MSLIETDDKICSNGCKSQIPTFEIKFYGNKKSFCIDCYRKIRNKFYCTICKEI